MTRLPRRTARLTTGVPSSSADSGALQGRAARRGGDRTPVVALNRHPVAGRTAKSGDSKQSPGTESSLPRSGSCGSTRKTGSEDAEKDPGSFRIGILTGGLLQLFDRPFGVGEEDRPDSGERTGRFALATGSHTSGWGCPAPGRDTASTTPILWRAPPSSSGSREKPASQREGLLERRPHWLLTHTMAEEKHSPSRPHAGRLIRQASPDKHPIPP